MKGFESVSGGWRSGFHGDSKQNFACTDLGESANNFRMADAALLEALAHKIQTAVNASGRCMVTLPAERATLAGLGGETELREWARRHHWTVVSHLGGEMIEFFRIRPGQIA